MQWIALSLLALSLFAPVAMASEDARIEDAALDAFPPPVNAWADITGASIAIVDEDTLRLTVFLTALPEIQPGAGYCVVFADGASEFFGCLVAVPDVNYLVGKWSQGGPAGSDGSSGAYVMGPGGQVMIDLPRSLLAPAATELSTLRAYAVDVKPGAAPVGLPTGEFVTLDTAEGDATLVLPAPDTASGQPGPAGATASTGETPATAAGPSGGAAAKTSAIPGPTFALVVLALALVAYARR